MANRKKIKLIERKSTKSQHFTLVNTSAKSSSLINRWNDWKKFEMVIHIEIESRQLKLNAADRRLLHMDILRYIYLSKMFLFINQIMVNSLVAFCSSNPKYEEKNPIWKEFVWCINEIKLLLLSLLIRNIIIFICVFG